MCGRTITPLHKNAINVFMDRMHI
uniref:Uncharacterized protein n=1 Tax=Arundo donax TaxID=35708 RepID=A0A0A8YPR9_ARUDO